MALIKQLALGSEVLAPIMSVVIVRTVVTPVEHTDRKQQLYIWFGIEALCYAVFVAVLSAQR